MTKSKGHVALKDGFEYYLDAQGNLYTAKENAVIDLSTGYRIGRWEAPPHLADLRLKMLGIERKQ